MKDNMKVKKFIALIAICSSMYGEQVFEEVVNAPPPTELPAPHQMPVEDPLPAPHDSLSRALTKMLLTLLALIVLFGISYYLLKRVGRSRQKGMNNMKAIKIRERRPISPKTTLYLIELAGKEILLSESQLEVRHLSTYEWPDEEPVQPITTRD